MTQQLAWVTGGGPSVTHILFSRRSLEPSLTIKVVNSYHLLVLDLQVTDDPATATMALEPMRSRLRASGAAAAFGDELTKAFTKLVSKYYDESTLVGHAHRLVAVAQPLLQKSNPKEPS